MSIKSYPWIPAKTWYALRNRFKQTMPPRVTADYLASLLGISRKAAANIMPHLKAVKLIEPDGRINQRTSRWRDDEAYADVCSHIRHETYPTALLQLAPGPATDHAAVARWFVDSAGAGPSTAKKMARFYQMLARADTAEDKHMIKTAQENNFSDPPAEGFPAAASVPQYPQTGAPHPAVQLHLNIVIPPEATAEQIDTLFASAARHFKQLRLGIKMA